MVLNRLIVKNVLNVEKVVNKKKVRFVKSNKKSVTFAQNYLGNKKELFPNNCLTKKLKLCQKFNQKLSKSLSTNWVLRSRRLCPKQASPTTLGADSLDTVELIMEFEKAFDIQIPDEDAEKIATVGDAIKYIEEHKK